MPLHQLGVDAALLFLETALNEAYKSLRSSL
jgi:hypothetical protein